MKESISVTLIIFVCIWGLAAISACSGNSPQGENSGRANTDENGNDQSGQSRDQDRQGDEEEAALIGVPVKVLKVGQDDISTGILSTSVVYAEQSVEVYSRVTATVTQIEAEEGDTASKGDLLCKLEDEQLRLDEAKAKANMEKLKRDLDRVKQQVEKKVLAENDLINAQYAHEQARIEWEQKKTSLEYTEIRSTINGIVSERLVRLGQKVDPSVKLYSLFDPDSLVVNIHIPESDYFSKIADKIRITRALLTSDSLPGVEFTGSIKRVAPVVDPETNTIKITLKYQDPRRILLPGMYVKVKLITDTHENAVLIPKRAIIYDENRMYVFLVRGGSARRILLKPGYSDSNYVESTAGIETGESVVVVGQTGLKDGTKVRVVEVELPGQESSVAPLQED